MRQFRKIWNGVVVTSVVLISQLCAAVVVCRVLSRAQPRAKVEPRLYMPPEDSLFLSTGVVRNIIQWGIDFAADCHTVWNTGLWIPILYQTLVLILVARLLRRNFDEPVCRCCRCNVSGGHHADHIADLENPKSSQGVHDPLLSEDERKRALTSPGKS